MDIDAIDELMISFKELNKSMHYIMMNKTAKFDISPDQTKLLFIVDHHENINQNALAKKLHITKATLSVRLQRLEKMGYLIRKQDETDKRNYILAVSDSGKAIINETIKIMKEDALMIFNGVTSEQLDVIREVLNIMKKNVEKSKGECR